MKEIIRFVFVLCYTDLYININILGRKSDCKKWVVVVLYFKMNRKKKITNQIKMKASLNSNRASEIKN